MRKKANSLVMVMICGNKRDRVKEKSISNNEKVADKA
jgi:hypothetical protein